jgi:hypothetical protein
MASALTIVVACGSLAACSGGARPNTRRLPDGSRLVQKREFQALYGPTGKLERALSDADGDGVAEAIVYYRSDGKPERSELDTDGDHAIDRWETLRRDGTVAVSAHSRRGGGLPDAWAYVDEDGFVYQNDFDDDGDGTVDRTEYKKRPDAEGGEAGDRRQPAREGAASQRKPVAP